MEFNNRKINCQKIYSNYLEQSKYLLKNFESNVKSAPLPV